MRTRIHPAVAAPRRPAARFALAAALSLAAALPGAAAAQAPQGAEVQPAYASAGAPQPFRSGELVNSGHQFFGTVSRGLASAVEEAVRRWGEPNGYILGQEASGAVIGGLRYGEGKLFTRNRGNQRVFWQGPSLGFDFGGEGARTMMLVYNLPDTSALYRRFGGVDGSAYLVGGFGVSAAAADGMVVVPIRSGVGARLGLNVGYLKFTAEPTWNPF
jgi:hypothetical protein